MPYASNIFFRMRWMAGLALAGLVAMIPVALSGPGDSVAPATASATAPVAAKPAITPALVTLAERDPAKRVEVIVQLDQGVKRGQAAPMVSELGGRVTRDLHIINAVVAKLPASGARDLASRPGVRAVSMNGAIKSLAMGDGLTTAYNSSIQATTMWNEYGGTGKGVGVAVIDTGIAGDLADFRVSSSDHRSRVIGSAVTNPDATTATDRYGHGTHVAGIIAGDSANRSYSDPLRGRYSGVAPDANLISIKASDDEGDATVLDVINGIQFAVDNKERYNIRVLNLSLESTVSESYKTDPLNAAVEAAWFDGIFVVAAAGNRGTGADAVSRAPGNDPYIVTVGAVDDQGTKSTYDDRAASWSSRGTTQDGFAKPDVYAPGAKIVSNLAPGSAYAALCPTCVVNGQYIRTGGTSMAAPMVAGAAAIGFQLDPTLTPNKIKALLKRSTRTLADGAKEVNLAQAARIVGEDGSSANQGLTPNEFIDPATGTIDYTRSSWSRSSWSEASDLLRSSWSRSSWSCAVCFDPESPTGAVDETGAEAVNTTRSSWSRSSWSRSSWSTSWDK